MTTEYRHNIDKDSFVKILHLFDKGSKLNIAEYLEIVLSCKRGENLNDQLLFSGTQYFKNLPLK